jgi:hypothetical protein
VAGGSVSAVGGGSAPIARSGSTLAFGTSRTFAAGRAGLVAAAAFFPARVIGPGSGPTIAVGSGFRAGFGCPDATFAGVTDRFDMSSIAGCGRTSGAAAGRLSAAGGSGRTPGSVAFEVGRTFAGRSPGVGFGIGGTSDA